MSRTESPNSLSRAPRRVSVFLVGAGVIVVIGLRVLGTEDGSGRWAAQLQLTAVALLAWTAAWSRRGRRNTSSQGPSYAPAAWAAGASLCLVAVAQLDPRWTAWLALAVLMACVGNVAIATTRAPLKAAIAAQVVATWVALAVGGAAVSIVEAVADGAAIGPLWQSSLIVVQGGLAMALAALQGVAWLATHLRVRQPSLTSDH